MYTPTYVQLKYWYHPVGNTPAVNLLRDLQVSERSDRKHINFLSLACGDPRNVLFTLWCEQGNVTRRHFSFTCCDIEPAILARNIVLYTFIVDDLTVINGNESQNSILWRLFYHFYIPEMDLVVLHHHVGKLIDASSSYETWTSSSYGAFVKYVDKATLIHLRKYWIQYAASERETHVQKRNEKARDAIAKRSKEIGNGTSLNGVRATGPLWPNALETMSDTYRKFWQTGIAGGNRQDIGRLENEGKGKVNPMFAVSSAPSQDFAVHYGTEPLTNFHIPEAFQDRPLSKNTVGKAEQAVTVAKAQFRDWCNIFQTFVQENGVTVRCFFGDALALGHALQLQPLNIQTQESLMNGYSKAWSSDILCLDGDCPTQPFDVVDTSNLGDHVGLINVLTATAPLLIRNPAAVLYTESLLMASEDIAASLSTLLGSDVTTFSLLIGLVPSGLLNNVTMDAVGNEAALSVINSGNHDQRQYRMRLTWKHLTCADITVDPDKAAQVGFDEKQLAAYLFSIYKTMFATEDATQLQHRLLRLQEGRYSIDRPRYTRAGMVALLRVAQSIIHVDWDQTMCDFLDLVESDRSLIVGSNSLQELYMYMDLAGVWTHGFLRKDPRQFDKDQLPGMRPTGADSGLLALDPLPPVVHLVLLVPRKKLEVFTKKDLDKVGTPALHVSVTQEYGSNQFENCFFSFQCFFGSIQYDHQTFEIRQYAEDENGWSGTKDLVVIAAVPTSGLLVGPRQGLRVALKINTSPDAIMAYSSLSPPLQIYQTELNGDKGCFVCRHPPGSRTLDPNVQPMNRIQAARPSTLMSSKSMVKLDVPHKATHFQTRASFPQDSDASRALARDAFVTLEHLSPSTVTACIGTAVRYVFAHPCPIQGSKVKIRIARKSSWIEVIAPISTAQDVDNFHSWTQMATREGEVLLPRDITRVDFSIQPRLSLSKSSDTSWITTFLGPTLSDTENAVNAATQNSPTSGSVKVDLKQSLNTIISSFAGQNNGFNQHNPGRTCQLFQLMFAESCHTIIFVTAIHHDLDLGSIVLQAYVFPLTMPKVMSLKQALTKLQSMTTPLGVHVTPAENTLWKHLFPALAERCRDYPHKPSCEYQRPGATIPLSTAEAESPICSCGEGRISASDFVKLGNGCKAWGPFAKHVTRIAISPIFPVPFVENSMSALKTPTSKLNPASPLGGTASLPVRGGRGGNEALADAGKNCHHCGGAGGSALKTCAGCGKARYCGPACQKAAWKTHKGVCRGR